MSLTQNQVNEIENLVKEWFKRQNILSDGIVVRIEVLPVRIIINSSFRNRKNKGYNNIREFSESEWNDIFSIASSGSEKISAYLVAQLTKLKGRNNAGLTPEDFPGEDSVRGGYRFKQRFNALSFKSNSAYRVLYPRGDCWKGPYYIGVKE